MIACISISWVNLSTFPKFSVLSFLASFRKYLPGILFLFLFWILLERVSICYPGWHGTHDVAQFCFKLISPPTSASEVLDLRTWLTMTCWTRALANMVIAFNPTDLRVTLEKVLLCISRTIFKHHFLILVLYTTGTENYLLILSLSLKTL